jgi:hypothetical protein
MNASNGAMFKIVWAGRIVTGLTVVLLLVDAFGKIAEVAPVVEGTARLGYPPRLVFIIGSSCCALRHT